MHIIGNSQKFGKFYNSYNFELKYIIHIIDYSFCLNLYIEQIKLENQIIKISFNSVLK